MTKASALWHLSPQQSAIQETKLAPFTEHHCLLRALYSLVSTGTERRVASGKVPSSLHSDMEVPYMEGSFSFPIKYGYSLVGKIEKGPPHLLHKLVHLLHPHQNFCRVHADDVFVIPAHVPPQRAILASNLETALNAIWDARVSIGDKVLVAGFGIIGSLTARLLQKIPATQVAVMEPDPHRSQLARQMGFILAGKHMQDFDMAFHTSGSSEGLQTCLDLVGFEGKVIELSWYGNQPVALQLGGTFHSARKQIISSQVAHLPADRQGRWDYMRRKSVIFELLRDSVFDQHITKIVKFQDLPRLFEQLRTGDLSELSWSVAY